MGYREKQIRYHPDYLADPALAHTAKWPNTSCSWTTTTDGQAALEAVARQLPDIILLDVMMPRMDGWETLDALQSNEQTADIPVLMLTAMHGSEPVQRSFDHGSVWYYSKPVTDIYDLLLVIRRILERQDEPAS